MELANRDNEYTNLPYLQTDIENCIACPDKFKANTSNRIDPRAAGVRERAELNVTNKQRSDKKKIK